MSFRVLPVPVADAADGAAKLGLRQVAQGADGLGQGGAGEQGGGDVLGHTACEGEQRLGLQPEIGGDGAQEGLGRPLRAAFDQREIGRRDAKPAGQGADRVAARIPGRAGEAGTAQAGAKVWIVAHKCKVYTLHPKVKKKARRVAGPLPRRAVQPSPAPRLPWIIAMNSRRVEASSRKAPSMREVTIDTPVLCTPRVVMH